METAGIRVPAARRTGATTRRDRAAIAPSSAAQHSTAFTFRVENERDPGTTDLRRDDGREFVHVVAVQLDETEARVVVVRSRVERLQLCARLIVGDCRQVQRVRLLGQRVAHRVLEYLSEIPSRVIG